MATCPLHRVPLAGLRLRLRLLRQALRSRRPMAPPVIEAVEALAVTQAVQAGADRFHASFVPMGEPQPDAAVLAMQVGNTVHTDLQITILPNPDNHTSVHVIFDRKVQEEPIVMAAVLRALEGDGREEHPHCELIFTEPPKSPGQTNADRTKLEEAHTGGMTPPVPFA